MILTTAAVTMDAIACASASCRASSITNLKVFPTFTAPRTRTIRIEIPLVK